MSALGNHTIVLRSRKVTGRDDWGNDVLGDVDRLVHFCLVTPTQSTESEDRSAPSIQGARLLAPVSVGEVEAVDAVIWPVTGQETVGGVTTYRGRSWEVVGDVGPWDEFIEAQLRRTT